MALSAKFVSRQLEIFKPLLNAISLERARTGQEQLGNIMTAALRKKVYTEECICDTAAAVFVTPEKITRSGIILYLHGGGYCCGGLNYAKGVASVLANKCGTKVLAAAYGLSPEAVFPTAVNDSLAAYKYLLDSGYDSRDIVLCGESAGGGLIFALCMLLKQQGLPLPAGLMAFSPWTDMTSSSDSYTDNADRDPTMSKERLEFFRDLYIKDEEDFKNPLASPVFGDLSGLPKTIIFVGGNEVMLGDAELIHEKLTASGVESEIIVAPEMWHAYILYDLKERSCDYLIMEEFLDKCLRSARKLQWMRLDNAAKIYPAAKRRNWSNVFRLSATLKDEVSVGILKSALERTIRRFPSMAVRLCRSSFWYYLEEVKEPPTIREDLAYPLEKMNSGELHKCAFRVIVYEKRIAVEFFHSITDGNGALIFLKTLLAEYAEQRYGVRIPCEKGVLDRREEPLPEEIEDSFLKYSGETAISRKDTDAYKLKGTREPGPYTHVITFVMNTDEVMKAAKSHNVSVTAFLCAVTMQAITEIQRRKVRKRSKRKPVKVLIPVNLRKLFKSSTLRNFVLYMTPYIEPAMGDYTFDEICKTVYHQMGMEITAKRMGGRITTNVNSEKSFIVKIMPLFIKNFVMKMIYNAVGERKTCITLSNLGKAEMPQELAQYIDRMDFVLSVPASSHHNCSVISFGDVTTMTFVRNITETELEKRVHRILKGFGITVTAESNATAISENYMSLTEERN